MGLCLINATWLKQLISLNVTEHQIRQNMTDEITLVPVCSWNDLLLLNVATYILSYLLCCFILVCSRAVTTVSTQSVPNSVKNAPAKCDIKDSLCSLLTVLYRSFYPLTCNQIQLIQIKKKRKFRVCSACLWVDETIVVVYSAWSLINCMLHSFIPLFFWTSRTLGF